MKFQEREDVRKKTVTHNMHNSSIENIDKSTKFLNYAVSRAKVALMRDSIKKVRANRGTLESIKLPQKYNLRSYGI